MQKLLNFIKVIKAIKTRISTNKCLTKRKLVTFFIFFFLNDAIATFSSTLILV